MSSLEGWPTVMYAGIDSAGIQDHSPSLDHNPARALYFIVWVLAGGMVLINLFVGVLVVTFTAQNEQQSGATTKLMNDSQQQWASTYELMLQVGPMHTPPKPLNTVRALCWQLVHSPRLESLILLVIFFNTILMGLDGYHVAPATATLLFELNVACTVIFVLEAVVKIAGLSFQGYLADWWNVFDFGVVLVSAVDIVADSWAILDESHVLQPTFLRILRLLRILRTMRAIKSSRGLRTLLTTLFTSLPALANVLSVFLLIEFSYSVLGMHLFRHVKWADPNADFCTFSAAFLTMFRCATGEGWNSLMHNAMEPSDECTEEQLANGDCGSWLAVPFFVSYTIITTFVILKMIVALIIENFVISLKQEGSRIRPRHTDAFVAAWGAHDPWGLGHISLAHLFGVINELPPPLGLDPKRFQNNKIRDVDVSRFILSLGLRAYRSRTGGSPYVLFHEVLSSLLDTTFHDVLHSMHSAGSSNKVVHAVEARMRERLDEKRNQELQTVTEAEQAEIDATEEVNVADHYAVYVIQRRWRAKSNRTRQWMEKDAKAYTV